MTGIAEIRIEDLIPADPDHFTRLIHPWTIESMPEQDPRWRGIVDAKRKELNAKVRWRKLKAAFSLSKSISSFRQPSYVKQRYDRIWTEQRWQPPVSAGQPVRKTHITWRGEGHVVAVGAVRQPHLDRLMHLIELLKPRTVLEIGAGTGRNLFAIAGAFPDTSFAGLELSDAGIRAANEIKSLDVLPAEALVAGTHPVVDKTAFKRVELRQGTAAELPYAARSFDLVFSRQAIEQMNAIHERVFGELARVCARYAVLIEPFADFACNDLHRFATLKKNHFGGRVSGLPAYGLDPVAVFSDWPQKLDQGLGLVVAHREER